MTTRLPVARGQAVLALATALLLAACGDRANPLASPDAAARADRAATSTTAYQQIDRNGNPIMGPVYVPAADKDAFNRASPADDPANYRAGIAGSLRFFGMADADADALAARLTPDVVHVDLSQPIYFPNGRGLADDVGDVSLTWIYGPADAARNTDHLPANDKPFRSTFPYLAGAHVQ